MKYRSSAWFGSAVLTAAMFLVAQAGRPVAAAPRPLYDMSGYWVGTFRATGRDAGVVEANFAGDAGGGRQVVGGFTLFSDFGLIYPLPINGKLIGRSKFRAAIKGDTEETVGTLQGTVHVRANRLKANFRFRDAGRLIRGTLVMHKEY